MIYSKHCHCILSLDIFSLCRFKGRSLSPLIYQCFEKGRECSQPLWWVARQLALVSPCSHHGMLPQPSTVSLNQHSLHWGEGAAAKFSQSSFSEPGTCQGELLLFTTAVLFTSFLVSSFFYSF